MCPLQAFTIVGGGRVGQALADLGSGHDVSKRARPSTLEHMLLQQLLKNMPTYKPMLTSAGDHQAWGGGHRPAVGAHHCVHTQ
jgi:hypothetical protein